MLHSISRGLSFAIGLFLLASALAGILSPRLDTTVWLLDLRWLPRFGQIALSILLGSSLVWAGLARVSPRTRTASIAAAIVLAIVGTVDALRFWGLLRSNAIESSFPVPASLLVCLSGVLILCTAIRIAPGNTTLITPRRSRVVTLATAIAAIGAFPLVQMICFGTTDYRRNADAVLVLGARAYADGSASNALEDRILAACELVHEGRADTLILSGGPGDGAFHETDVMRRIALEQGVREDQLLIDREGLNSKASIVNTMALCEQHRFTSVLAVSHFYHLPRLKLEASRADLPLYTVPASQRGRVLKKLPYFMAREAAAWWWSYAKGMAG